jgi:hypothetical protein
MHKVIKIVPMYKVMKIILLIQINHPTPNPSPRLKIKILIDIFLYTFFEYQLFKNKA